VKTEPKAFASLSSGLLARKGAARPAMRPQGFGQGASGLEDLGWNDMGFEPPKPAAGPVRDESHDAFGEEVSELHSKTPATGLTPVDSPVHSQQAEIAGRLSAYTPDDAGEEADETAELYQPEEERFEPEEAAEAVEARVEVEAAVEIVPVARAPRRAPAPRSIAGSKAKAAFTLRLDRERHLKLRLASAVSGQSAQILVTRALDQLLAAMPELDAMANKAKPKG
jgi:hypothetical protein